MSLKRAISLAVPKRLYDAITAAARAARQSRSAWLQVAAEEKLARLEQERMCQRARPAGDGEDAA